MEKLFGISNLSDEKVRFLLEDSFFPRELSGVDTRFQSQRGSGCVIQTEANPSIYENDADEPGIGRF